MVTILQRANSIILAGNGTISFPNPTTPGSTLIAVTVINGLINPFGPSITDDAGNNWTSAPSNFRTIAQNVGSTGPVRNMCWVYVAQNPTGSSSSARSAQTLTFAGYVNDISTQTSVWIYEVSGQSAGGLATHTSPATVFLRNLVDSNNGGVGPGSVPTAAPVAPTASTGDGGSGTVDNLFLAVVGPTNGSISAVNSPWTLEPVQNGFALAYQIATTTVDQQAIFTNGTIETYCSIYVVLVGSGAPPPPNGTIIINKVTSPVGSSPSFTFNPSWKSVFTLQGGQSNSSSLVPGTYSITEDPILNWNTVVTGGDPASIVLASGDTVTLTFTNTFVEPVPPGPVCYADGIIPTGAINGVNTSFTLPTAPNPPGSLILESDSSILAPGVGFTLSFVLVGTQLNLVYPPKNSLVAWYRVNCSSGVPPLYKLVDDQGFDDNAFTNTPTVINSTYFTSGFVNSAKSAQNPLLGFHRKRYQEIQINVRGAGQMTVETFPNYILKQNLSYNPSAYVLPPIALQTDPPDDLVRPLNSVGNRVYVMFTSSAIGAYFHVSKTIMVGVMDAFNVVNPNAG